jgi:hypothetical protein
MLEMTVDTDASRCVLCGAEGIELVVFYLRTTTTRIRGKRVAARVHNHASRCCEACFDRVERLQDRVQLMNIIAFGPMSLAGLVLLVAEDAVPGSLLAATMVSLALGLVGLAVNKRKRRLLVSQPHLQETIARLERHHVTEGMKQMGLAAVDEKVTVVPLTSVGDGAFEADR